MEFEETNLIEIFPGDSNFQFVAQVLHVSDVIAGRTGRFRKILLRDTTAVIYAFMYSDHNFAPNKQNPFEPSSFIRVIVPYGYNSVRKCNAAFCANCHPNKAEIVLRSGRQVELLPVEPDWPSELNFHIPFKFTDLEDIQQLKYRDVVDVIGVVRRIHWAKDDDKEGIWDWVNCNEKPYRQFEIINVFPHQEEGTCIRCTVWGSQWAKLTTVGAVIALKGAKIDQGFGDRYGLNVGNTCEIFYINDDDDMWLIPDSMKHFYWKLFGVQENCQNVEGDSSNTRSHVVEEVDLEIENVVYKNKVNGNDSVETKTPVNFLTDSEPLNIIVTQAKEFLDVHGKDREPVYTMRSQPRGLAIIINNIYYDDEDRPTEKGRKGSFHDERYMQQLFEQMGFEAYVEINVKANTFENVISQFKSRFDQRNYDCSVVVVMSHGAFNKIELVDGNAINIWSDLVYQFNDNACPSMVGKPKLFIFQSCQNFSTTGTGQQNTPSGSHVMSDTLVCFPALPGTTACRDEVLGSHYIYCLAKVFMENAHRLHVEELLREVERLLSFEAIVDKEDRRQCYSINLGFRRLLFFNPGL